MLTLPYPLRRDEIRNFVMRHHYTRRCPAVWTVAYAIQNPAGKIQAVAIYSPPPYPSVTRAFVRCPEHESHLIWQTRMVGVGISTQQLDELLTFARADLLRRDYWWTLTLTDPTAACIDNALLRLTQPGFTGRVYNRNGWLYLGTAGSRKLTGFLIDGQSVHIRQNRITLTLSNVQTHYPDAKNIRALYGGIKHRFADVLAYTSRERAERILLMKYQPQVYEVLRQPRLLWKIFGGELCAS
jgi:hypothetical protein